MSEEKRMIGSYEVEHSIHLGDKEVILGVDKKEQYPFMVCYCTYDNPLGVPWATEAVGSDDYLEAMQVFLDRVQAQVELSRAELAKYPFDKTVFTVKDCIPDDRNSSIVGKVVVINAEPKRYEYQHPAYQLVLVDGGHGATGGRGQAVFGTCLATGEHRRWERYDVLGEKQRTGRNADGGASFITARTEIHLFPEYADCRTNGLHRASAWRF